MIALQGIYRNGVIELERKIISNNPIKVIVTFLDDDLKSDSKSLNIDDFSFQNSRRMTFDYKGNLSDSIIEERRDEL